MLKLVDRLVERGWIDRWGFIGFAFGGAVLIIFAKAFNVDPVWVAIGAAGAIVLYAVIVQRSGTGRLRGDQAGDNCYYLGLIFTLVSLAHAIFTFDPVNTATTIIQGFGVALATTIVGLVLRVFFNQTRADVVEVEDTARLELADTAGRLKSELSQIVVSMNDFGRQMRQSLEEMQGEVATTLTEVKTEAATVVKAQADDATSRSKRLLTATDKVVSGFERSASSFSQLEASHSGLADSIASIEQAAGSTRMTLEEIASQASELQEMQRGMSGTVSTVNDVALQVLQQVHAFDEAASRFEQQMSARFDALKAVPEDIARDTANGIEASLTRLTASLDALVEKQDQISREAVAMAARQNEALEAELTRSRELVGKVHGALVDMTGQLVERLEERKS